MGRMPTAASKSKAPRKTKDQGSPAAPRTTDAFENAFAKLNDAQRLAVSTIEGPVMVVAGPGTGKTQVVALRVANILRRTQMRPGNILCLTFSGSGATAMRERLRSLIGPDAYGVTVSTIHGFCQNVIDQNPVLFEEWSARTQLSDIEKYRELNTIIDHLLPNLEAVNRKDPYGRDAEILGRISQVKREGKTQEDLERALKEYESVMSQKSKEGTKAHAKNLLAVRKFADFLEIFRRYQAMLRETGRYDYDDMILFVLEALKSEEWLLANLQERYKYILVDEFQDTNGAQWGLIDRLSSAEQSGQEPNLFVVGDDDQAIYRFQGANLQNMLGFRKRFPAAPVIALTVSYRSTQKILDAARSLIERNEERLAGTVPGLEKVLTAASGMPGLEPRLLLSVSDAAEPWLIADLVEERIGSGTPSEEIAILTQTNAELDTYEEVLRARCVPVQMLGKKDLLQQPRVQQALVILEATSNLGDDGTLAAALACDTFLCHPADLGRLFSRARAEKTSILDVLLAVSSDAEQHFAHPAALVGARDTLLSLSQKIPSRTVLDTVEHVLRDCGLLPGIDHGDPLDLGAVEAFFGYVKGRCKERPTYDFRHFISDLRFYEDPQYGQVRLAYTLPHLVEKGVQLMTAHQSKGREFQVVLLANFRDGHWDKRRKPGTFAIPEDLLFGWEKEQKTFEQHQDERRLAFVAMTRAKRELLFLCPKELTVGDKTRAVSPSGFFAEAGLLPEEDRELKDPSHASTLILKPLRAIDDELAAYIRERLETFALSATALNRFLDDPRNFLAIDILGQPERFDEPSLRRLAYGNAAHWALRQWGVARQKNRETDVAGFLHDFDWHVQERSILTERQREDIVHLGHQNLPPFFAERLAGRSQTLHGIEREYRVRLGDIPLKGRIDRIDLASPASATATVIDYKARAPQAESVIRGGLEPGSVSKTSEGNYFRQLAFYALLLEHGDPLLRAEAFVLEYIGEGEEKALPRSFAVTDDEKKALSVLVKDVWAKITALDFSPL